MVFMVHYYNNERRSPVSKVRGKKGGKILLSIIHEFHLLCSHEHERDVFPLT